MSSSARPILVVDDDEDVRNMMCLVLSVAGYATSGAADGVEALNQLRYGERPALIIVDLMMPKMDGVTLIRTMSADSSLSRIPVAIISGQPAGPQAASPQVIARLVKPIELEELLDVAREFANGAN